MKSKEKRAAKFANVILGKMVENEMTFNEASGYILELNHFHWTQFQNIRGQKKARECARIISAIENLQRELSNWNFTGSHRHFDKNANVK